MQSKFQALSGKLHSASRGTKSLQVSLLNFLSETGTLYCLGTDSGFLLGLWTASPSSGVNRTTCGTGFRLLCSLSFSCMWNCETCQLTHVQGRERERAVGRAVGRHPPHSSHIRGIPPAGIQSHQMPRRPWSTEKPRSKTHEVGHIVRQCIGICWNMLKKVEKGWKMLK